MYKLNYIYEINEFLKPVWIITEKHYSKIVFQVRM